MNEWLKRLIDVLTSFDHPIDLADLKRLIGPSPDAPAGDPDDKFLFDAIYRISTQVENAGLKLVIEEGHCSRCGKTNYFSPNYSYTCQYCNEGVVSPPKFCINRRDAFY